MDTSINHIDLPIYESHYPFKKKKCYEFLDESSFSLEFI